MGNLVFQATLGGQVNLVGPNTASTFNLNVPAVSATLATTDANTFTAAQTFAAGSSSAPALTTTNDTNTGIFFPAADTIAFAEGGVEAMRLDSAGNMGLGVTPSAWGTFKALQVGGGGFSMLGGTSGVPFGNLVFNAYFDGSAWKYINSAGATYYGQSTSGHQWHNAASGTAGGTVTFTQTMTLDASGNLCIGTTSVTDKVNIYNGGSACGLSIATSNGSSFFATASASNNYINGVTAGNTVVRGSAGIAFSANSGGNLHAYIDTSGNLLVNSTSFASLDQNAFLISGSSGRFIAQHATGTASGTPYATFQFAATGIGSITQSGTTAVAYNTSSDYRLKENIAPMTGALVKVAALRPCTYKWKADKSDGEGFIAHELAEVCPQAVTGEKDAVDSDGNPVYQGIDTSFLVATLTAAIQELKAEFDAYKASHP